MKKILYQITTPKLITLENFFEEIMYNFMENIVSSNKTGDFRNKVIFKNECVIDINYRPEDIPFATIYNENDSIDKIQETKSILEQKTGWELKE